jgi:methylmalonyl-CoA mutase
LLWSKIIESFGGDEESQKIYIHARTSFNNQTKYDPYVNMLRTTTEAFSAVVGGVDSLHTNCFDETMNLPEEFARRIARNTQIILNEEAHLNQLIDPAGGSYFVENLTDVLMKKSWELFREVESKGGIIEALKSGFIQEQIDKIAEDKKINFAKRRTTQVGINAYANIKEEKIKYKKSDLYKKLLKKYEDYEKKKSLKTIPELNEKVFEESMKAVNEGATIFDIASALRKDEKADFKINRVVAYRTAEIFEELRDAALEYKEKNGNLPKVFLLPMGPLKQNKARADFSKAFFEIGGFDVVSQQRYHTVEAAIHSALISDSKIAVICSTDETYPELVPQIAKGIKEKDKDKILVLAGYPKDYVDGFKKCGVDEFIYLGCDAHNLLKSLMTKTGVIK